LKIPQDQRFRSERALFVLQFCCETCAGFDPDRGDCAYGYPVDEHRLERYLDPEVELVFCKDYDSV